MSCLLFAPAFLGSETVKPACPIAFRELIISNMKKREFLKAVDTLKLYRRAELIDEMGKELISDLYVDPLPDDHILNTVLKPNTTFLVGRKGTGKSTIFQRAQDAINGDKNTTWAYIP